MHRRVKHDARAFKVMHGGALILHGRALCRDLRVFKDPKRQLKGHYAFLSPKDDPKPSKTSLELEETLEIH